MGKKWWAQAGPVTISEKGVWDRETSKVQDPEVESILAYLQKRKRPVWLEQSEHWVCVGWLSWAWRWRHSLIGGALGAIIRNKKKKADIWSFKNKHDTNLFYILKVYSGLCVEDQPYGWQYWRQEILQGLLQCSGKKWWSPRPGDNRHREMWMYLAS